MQNITQISRIISTEDVEKIVNKHTKIKKVWDFEAGSMSCSTYREPGQYLSAGEKEFGLSYSREKRNN